MAAVGGHHAAYQQAARRRKLAESWAMACGGRKRGWQRPVASVAASKWLMTEISGEGVYRADGASMRLSRSEDNVKPG